MRWDYYNPHDAREAAEHADQLRRIDDWWSAFSSKANDLNELFGNRMQWGLPGWMRQHLGPIDANLMWEFGAALKGSGHRLVITPETRNDLRPMLTTLLERAPTLPGWEFYPYRPPENLVMAEQMVKARSHGDLSGTMVTVRIGQHNRIDLCFYSPSTTAVDDKQASGNAFVVTETLLGERILDQWIGKIDVAPLAKPSAIARLFSHASKPDPKMIPLDRLKPTVDALIAAITDQLPDQPLYALECVPTDATGKGEIGVLFKLNNPPQAGDYPHYCDMRVASAANQALWLAQHAPSPFYSIRYSRHGETFCYLKIDGSKRPEAEADNFPDRAGIEQALDDVLIPAKAGCVVSGGTGWQYSYIDLALANVDTAIPLITSRLRAGNIHHRSWLLFFDAPLSEEWIGIYDDTPAPPRPLASHTPS